jgi:uncharacterized small protein (DUF1192 family)
MSNPINEAFFFGKALAEVTTEKLEENLTNILSDIGKFDAEMKEKLRQFTEEVKNRAQNTKDKSTSSNSNITIDVEVTTDLQEIIDELRAEIARLKAELNNYRQKKESL